jgi:hypothetical protein
MTLEQKILVLDKVVCGESVATIGKLYHITESSVRTVKQGQALMRASVEATMPGSPNVSCKSSGPCVHVCRKVVDVHDDEHIQ